MSFTISQLSSFSAINRNLQLHRRLSPCLSLRSKLVVVASVGGNGPKTSSSDSKNNLNYMADSSTPHVEGTVNLDPTIQEPVSKKLDMTKPGQEGTVTQHKNTAIIHDFCFGIPYGALVLSVGVLNYLVSKNVDTLANSLVMGLGLLAMNIMSWRKWKQGKSNTSFIVGQAVFSGSFGWNNYLIYKLDKQVFPAGVCAVVSAAMVCFYLYVMMSGGNPPSRKKKHVFT